MGRREQAHLWRVMPEAEIDARVAMYTAADEEELLSGRPDFVLDAIDNIDTKVALLAACRRRGLPVLCVAAAGVCRFLRMCGIENAGVWHILQLHSETEE